jgi:ABC-type microcin C transport system duplicated ATPase subunit YejF
MMRPGLWDWNLMGCRPICTLAIDPSLKTPTFQNVSIDGYNQKKMRSLRKEMQVVFQDPFGSLSPRMSIAKIIEEGLAIHKPEDRDEFEAEK